MTGGGQVLRRRLAVTQAAKGIFDRARDTGEPTVWITPELGPWLLIMFRQWCRVCSWELAAAFIAAWCKSRVGNFT